MGKRFIFSFLLVIAVVLSAAGLSSCSDTEAEKAQSVSAENENPGVYIIDMTNTDTSAGGENSAGSIDEALKVLEAVDPDYEILYSYANVIDGVAVKTTEEAADAVSDMENVNVYNSRKYKINEYESSMFSVGNEVASSGINTSGYRGEGMTVAVIDTSFDVNHELFVLSDDTSAKFDREYIDGCIESGMAATKYFADNKGKTPYVSAKIPFAYDYFNDDLDTKDTNGHGTHVAGIIAANKKGNPESGFDGIAPEAQLVLMKIAEDGATYVNDVALLAALDDAMTLHVDSINISFGMTAGSSEGSVSSTRFYNLFEYAKKSGIDIFCAAGNDGSIGIGSNYYYYYGVDYPIASNPDYGLINEPASFDSAIAVASCENEYVYLDKYIKSNENDIILFSESNQKNFAEKLGNSTLSYVFLEGCGYDRDYVGYDVNGKIVVVMRGTITFEEKAKIAEEHGAAGIIIYNNVVNEEELINMQLWNIELPAAYVSYKSGVRLGECKFKTLTVMSSEITSFVSAEGGEMSDFSSWGTTAELALKPDITAPGGNVWSTYTDNGYQSASGTSMATPVTTGASLLIKEYLRVNNIDTGEDSSFIRKLMMTSAIPLLSANSSDIEYSPRKQGAGLVNVDSAVNSAVIMTDADGKQSKLELKDKLGSIFDITFKVQNISDKDMTYYLSASLLSDTPSYDAASDTYFISGYSSAFTSAVIKLSDNGSNLNRHAAGFTNGEKIVIPAKGTREITLKVNASGKMFDEYKKIFSNGFFLEGFIYLIPVTDGKSTAASASIPYMGFSSDWDMIPIFDVNADGAGTLVSGTSKKLAFYDYQVISYLERGGNIMQYALGTNLFMKNTGFAGKLIAISPDGDTKGEYIGVAINPMRNISSMRIDIYDSDGELVCTKRNMKNIPKAYYIGENNINTTYVHYIWDGTDSENSKYTLPDGIYKFVLSANISSDVDTVQYLSFDFRIDTVKPETGSARIVRGEKGKSYLEISASDDYYLQAGLLYTVSTGKDGEAEDELNSLVSIGVDDPVSDKLFRFDITGYENVEYFYLDVVDYAFNTTTVKIYTDELVSAN